MHVNAIKTEERDEKKKTESTSLSKEMRFECCIFTAFYHFKCFASREKKITFPLQLFEVMSLSQ